MNMTTTATTQDNHPSDSVQQVARALGSLVRFQGELGLHGLDSIAPVPPDGVHDARVPEGPSGVFLDVLPDVPAREDPTDDGLRGLGLPEIQATLGACQRCKLCRGRTHIVFGVGDPRARVMFVGEGPGRDEDLQGEPFVGEAGKLLDRMIGAMGLARSAVYIANIIKCRPPRNRDPEPDEVAACEPFLRAQIRAVQPQAIVALGRVATQTLLRDMRPISRQRGQWRDYEGCCVMPTFHPAYLLRNPADKKLVWQDLQEVMRQLGLQGASVGK